MGKGDRYRPVDFTKWSEGWDRIWGSTMPLEQPEFKKFPKITRFSRPIIITEKIDGTNGQIYIDDHGNIFAGSRNRWLTIEEDNHGFCAWVMKHREELIEGLGPGRHYGEWWGQGINRGYGLTEKRFSLFNVQRWIPPEAVYIDYPCVEGPAVQWAPAYCSVVPILEVCEDFETDIILATLALLEHEGSRAAPGFMRPEGIVICHVPSGHLYKKTIEHDDEGKPV